LALKRAAMKIEYLRDGMHLRDLEAGNPGVRELLPPQAIRTGGRVRFVGMVRASGGESYMFLPKGGWRGEAEDAHKVAITTMAALSLYLQTMRREAKSPQNVGCDVLELAAELIDDFLQNGVIDQREAQASREVGKPDWAATFARDTPFHDCEGRTSFTSIRTQIVKSRVTSEISELHSAIMDEVICEHGWWLGVGPAVLDQFYHNCVPPREEALTVVAKARATSWSARAKRTMDLLEAYVLLGTGQADGVHATGVSDFSAVWEWMLAKVLIGNDRGWSKCLPRMAIRKRDGTVETVGDLRPDIVLREGPHLKIVDAKYYVASGASDMPGSADIRKQNDYLAALESIVDDGMTFSNHFAFPSEQTGEGGIAEIFQATASGAILAGSKPIICDYISISEVMNAVVQGRKMRYP
jgi:hypothetical protein